MAIHINPHKLRKSIEKQIAEAFRSALLEQESVGENGEYVMFNEDADEWEIWVLNEEDATGETDTFIANFQINVDTTVRTSVDPELVRFIFD